MICNGIYVCNELEDFMAMANVLVDNLRYAVNSCVYGLQNASDPLSSPCSIQTSCGPLVGAFQDGMEAPSLENKYSYCEAFGGSFQGPRLASCQKCLRLTDEQKYMGNCKFCNIR